MSLPFWAPLMVEVDGYKGLWSGTSLSPPKIGDIVSIYINSIGPATVINYRIVDGWFGLACEPLSPVPWMFKQNGYTSVVVFGKELGTVNILDYERARERD